MGNKFIDRRNWKSYNEELVARKVISYLNVGVRDKELEAMNTA
ncbi:MAG: hypothetical protein RXR51_06225 [Nitrososphaeria archaeon]